MNWINKIFRKVKTILLVSVGVVAIGGIAQAQPYYTPQRVINSATSTTTNLIFGPTTNGIWPNAIVGAGITTNLIKVDVSPYKEVTVQLSGAIQAANGAVTGQEVVLTLWKNVSGGSPTNVLGTGLYLEQAGLITNRFAASSAAGTTSTSHLNLGSFNTSGAVQSGYAAQLGGATTLYIGKLDATTLTNGTYYTNYSVIVNVK